MLREHTGTVSIKDLSDVTYRLKHRDLSTPCLHVRQVLREHTGTISIKDLSDMTAIKTEDILTTLQHLNLIQYQKGQHVLVANAKVIEK